MAGREQVSIFFTITQAFDPNAGGVQRTTFKLGKYFTEQGFRVYYYSFTDHGHVTSKYGQLFFPTEKGKDKNPENVQHLVETLSKIQPDIVINQMPYNDELREALFKQKGKLHYLLLGCLRNSLFNFKSNVRDRMQQMLPGLLFTLLDHAIGRNIILFRHWIKHRRDLKNIIDQHDFFILLAPPNRDELEYFVGKYSAHKIWAIPNSIPYVLEKLPPKEKTILHVGRLNVQQKRSDLLLEFWEQCHEELSEWKFVIVGDGPYLSNLREKIEAQNLPRVHLEGHQKPEAYYKEAAIFIMPSAYEGFPNTLIEAQSHGCASIVFDSYAALHWIVNNEKDALLIPAFNTKLMAHRTIALALESEQLTAMQRQALLNAQRFTIDTVGEIWLEFFDRHLRHDSK
ncbi:MAG: glycosyltransferase [Saprospiraceae bacterium]|nr:glycosyltransferase [Lewinella sp.]